MKIKALIRDWFDKWEQGDFLNLPVSDTFKHTSPFGTIDGKKNYIALVSQNKDKFLGYSFEIHDTIYNEHSACVRYTARQEPDFTLDVSEWYYVKNDLIEKIIAYYHIGDIRQDRQLETLD